jgi:hypothetical protein
MTRLYGGVYDMRGSKTSQKPFRDAGDIPHSGIEHGLVGFRWLMETAHLADELQSGGGNLLGSHQRIAAA